MVGYIPHMLKVAPSKPTKDISVQLRSKARMIVVTNVCNLNCGGCCQLIGHFSKEQLWFIGVEDLDKCIRLLRKYPGTMNHPITIFGGEPTLHPQWKEIVELLKSHAPCEFWINTNGRLGQKRYQREENLFWWVDLHPDSQLFVQTLYAAKDAIKLPNDIDYWKRAQDKCCLWNGCQSAIYNNKAYFCETAAALDHLYNNGENGWELDANKNPFDRTKEEIDEQAKHLCKRCGWCVADMVPRQLSKDPTNISPYNQTTKMKHALPVIQPTRPFRWKNYDSDALPPSIGIYRLNGECAHSNKLSVGEWAGVTELTARKYSEALADGKGKFEWTIVLEADQGIPNLALSSLIGWMCKERTKDHPRLHVSLPVYEIDADKYDPNMEEPDMAAKHVVIGFHKDSQENFDGGIYSRLGHRNMCEGYGRVALWHDNMTDVVGGVVKLI